MDLHLDGKAALVTGAAGGIGRATALALAAEGARVGVNARTAEAAAAIVAELELVGAIAAACPGDVSTPDGARAAVEAAVSAFAGLDVLFNSAGVWQGDRDGAVHEVDDDVWDDALAQNLTSVFLCCKHATPHLLAGDGGAIVNVGSSVALLGGRGSTAYAAAKGGVVAMTRTLAYQLAPAVRVNAICPGPTRTGMTRELWEPDGERWMQGLESIPLGRAGEPDDAARLVVFLVSDAARHLTGAIVPVDGGLTAHL